MEGFYVKKNRWLIAVVIVVITIAVMIALRSVGSQILLDNVETVTVEPAAFRWKYRTQGTVISNRHEYYFEGTVITVLKQQTDRISKDEVIFRYRDSEGKEKDYVSEIDGYLEEIGVNSVVISDLDYYLKVMLKGRQFDLTSEGCQALFQSDDREYLATLFQKKDYGIRKDDSVYYEADFHLDDNTGLKLNQQGTVTILIKEVDGVLAVDERAVMQKRDGTYLLKADWLNGKGDVEDCLIKVSVTAYDDGIAYLSDQGLEGIRACILSDYVMEMLND